MSIAFKDPDISTEEWNSRAFNNEFDQVFSERLAGLLSLAARTAARQEEAKAPSKPIEKDSRRERQNYIDLMRELKID